MRRLPLAVAAAAAVTAAAPAAAAPSIRVPMKLPSRATAASAGATWLVGGRPTAATARIARAAGGKHVIPGTYAVPVAAARGLAHTLRAHRLLTYAEPNRRAHIAAVAEDPLTADNPWREASFDPMLDPPVVTPDSPLLALVDYKAQIDHQEFTGDGFVGDLPGGHIVDPHGTETLGTAVAPVNGIGITGAYPGARAINVALPKRIGCSDSAKAIKRAIGAGAAVINMSYGSASVCFAEAIELENAIKHGIIPVAAAGNDGDRGNPAEYPASLPHVLTAGALTPSGRAASFSNFNGAIDLLAPGVSITVPVPLQFDTHDGNQDGYEIVDGTSFAAPIVSAAAVWLRAQRGSEMTPDQSAQLLRLSSTDLGPKGYDTDTGYGALNMAAALTGTPPAADPDEPNEDIPFIDGAALPGGPVKPIWKGGGPVTFQALADYYEDPHDVYRIRVPGKRSVTVTIKPDFGNPDLYLYDGGARTIVSRRQRHLVGASTHSGTKGDRVRIRNSSRSTRTAYIDVETNRRPVLDTRYSLDVR
ncbi:MAG: in [Solirubrobacteraceae bacterium]|nr:in [Solirubrobacteraceae bacterium]